MADLFSYMAVYKRSSSENLSLLIAIVLALGGLIITPYIVVVGVNFLSDYFIGTQGSYISNEVKALISVIVLVLLMSVSIVAISEYLHRQFSRKRAQQDHILREKNPELFNAITNYNSQKSLTDGP